jgi:hypothetical protein
MTVVGVVKDVNDVKHSGLARPMIGGMYTSLTAVDSANESEGLPSWRTSVATRCRSRLRCAKSCVS